MKKFTKRSLIALIAGLILLIAGVSSFALSASGLLFESEYKAEFYMNHLQIHLTENGKDVCGGKNTLDGKSKTVGTLAGYLNGNIEPGKAYREEIAARNKQDIPVYARITVRKYWLKKDGKTKATDLSPDMIKLTYEGEEYNTSAWKENPDERTSESRTYYYLSQIPASGDSEQLFNRLSIDSAVLDDVTENSTEKDGVTTYTYTYKYDGYTFMIEADVQAIQTHNANDAIKSQWGIYNVTENGGSLSVN